MLVMVLNEQIIPTRTVCETCLWADQTGQPRWSGDRLRCGKALHKFTEQQPDQFQCAMGFRVVNVHA
jgi:hypothetical protein